MDHRQFTEMYKAATTDEDRRNARDVYADWLDDQGLDSDHIRDDSPLVVEGEHLVPGLTHEEAGRVATDEWRRLCDDHPLGEQLRPHGPFVGEVRSSRAKPNSYYHITDGNAIEDHPPMTEEQLRDLVRTWFDNVALGMED